TAPRGEMVFVRGATSCRSRSIRSAEAPRGTRLGEAEPGRVVVWISVVVGVVEMWRTNVDATGDLTAARLPGHAKASLAYKLNRGNALVTLLRSRVIHTSDPPTFRFVVQSPEAATP